MDISSALSELETDAGDVPTIAADPCSTFQSGAPSTLVWAGQGALPDTNSQQLSSVNEIFKEHEANNTEVYFIEQSLDNLVADTDANGLEQPHNKVCHTTG